MYRDILKMRSYCDAPNPGSPCFRRFLVYVGPSARHAAIENRFMLRTDLLRTSIEGKLSFTKKNLNVKYSR